MSHSTQVAERPVRPEQSSSRMNKSLIFFAMLLAQLLGLSAIAEEQTAESKAEWEARRKRGEAWEEANKTGICEVHHIEMEGQVVPIIYGLPQGGDIPQEARWTLFPHAEQSVSGGCVVLSEAPTTAQIKVCPQCVEAKTKWRAKQTVTK